MSKIRIIVCISLMKPLFAILLSLLLSPLALSAQQTLQVDPTLPTDPARHTFAHLRDALLYAQREPNSPDTSWIDIRIAPSVYWLDDPDDAEVRRPHPELGGPYGMILKLHHTRLIGLGQQPTDVILASNRGQTQGAEGNFTMLHITGDAVEAENLTFGNYCNVDLEYLPNPTLSRPRRADAIVQAQLAIVRGDRYAARNCHFISRLNLCPFAGADHATFDRCYFECTDDALCGTGLYRHCRFTFFSSKPFYATSPQGATFIDCDLHSKVHGTQYLTKVSSPVRMYNCRWTSDDPNLQLGWTPKPNPRHYCEMTGCTLNGRPYNLSPTPDVPMPVAPLQLSLSPQSEIIAGQWTLDAYQPVDTRQYRWGKPYDGSTYTIKDIPAWSFGEGVDGAEGCFGLLQSVRGARMMYTGREGEQYHGQTLQLSLNPCKSAGQGFGSATGQYLDICIKFDTHTLTGYGLRFVRTPQYDRAVEVYLVEYNQGSVSAISEPCRCLLFRRGCHVTISAQANQLTAVITNPAMAGSDVLDGESETMTLTSPIAHPNLFGGIHIQHTGSLGPSGTVISSINCSYSE